MSNNERNEQQSEKRKMSLQEAIKQKLANKQQAQNSSKSTNGPVKNQVMKSQQTKKPNNQRKRMGV